MPEDSARSTGSLAYIFHFDKKIRSKYWMEVLRAPGTPGDVLYDAQVCFSERFMLRWFAQLRLSSELDRFQCRDTAAVPSSINHSDDLATFQCPQRPLNLPSSVCF